MLSAPAPAPKIPVVGYLTASSEAAWQVHLEPFRQGLRDLGYVEGQNVVLEYRFADGRDDRLPGLAADLVGRQVQMILAADTSAALAASTATQAVPIASATADPVGLGLVASLARPGGNVTGLSFVMPLLAGRKLEILKEVAPAARRAVVLWYAPSTGNALQLREVQDAAPRQNLALHPVGVQGLDDFEAAFEAVARERADALFVIGGPEFFTHLARILELVASLRLPAMYNHRDWAVRGGLMAYGVNLPAVHRRIATYVDMILKGAKPADIPIEQPTQFDFIINLKTAQALGVTIPQSTLVQATEIVQ
jgi:putative ABC transport system substrate-binding protein